MEQENDGLVLEWDEAKRQQVLTERGIDFEDAALILARPVLESWQLRDSELRCLAIGVLDGSVLAVVYVDRGRCRRIITARKAKRNERRRYYAHFAAGTDPPEG